VTDQFKQGQTVYTRDGGKYEYAEPLVGDRVLARAIMLVDNYDGTEEYPSDTPTILYLSQISAKPPVEAISAEIVKANAELSELQDRIGEKRRELLEEERKNTERFRLLKTYEPLKLVEDFILGKITHFVTDREYGRGVKVVTWDEFMIDKDDRGRNTGDIKLLSLFGRSKGNLEWRRNTYYDGSGGWNAAIPCLSYDEALQAAAEKVEAHWDAYRSGDIKVWLLDDTIKSAQALNLGVPDDIANAHQVFRREALEGQVAKAREDLAAKEAALAASEQVPA